MKKCNTFTANMDIREYMADHCVTQRMLAKQMSVSSVTINKMLKEELPQKEKEDILKHIDAIASEKLHTISEEIQPEETEDHTEETEETAEEDVTCSTKFQVGDRVKIPSKALLIGTVCDIWHSLVHNKLMYAVESESGGRGLYSEEQLEPAPLPIEYTFNATIENNVAVVCMIATQGDKTWVHARGHAHILHDGAVGMAQAVSFASKRMFESLDTKQENRIYFKEDSRNEK